MPRARRLLRERGAEAVLGGGGYVAGPAGLAAVSLGLPLVLTEADRHLGLTNRVLAPRARRVCLAFPIAGREGARYLVTGRPVPSEVGHADRAEARERFGIAAADRCLLVFGGSQGARSINTSAVEAFAGADAAARDFHVLHISGSRDHAEVEAALAAAPHTDRYTLCATSPASRRRSPPPTSSWPARAARSSRSPPPADRRSSSPIRTLRAATSTRTPSGWRRVGRRSSSRTISSCPAGCGSSRPGCSATPSAWRVMAAASAALARPDAAERVAGELLAAIGQAGPAS